MAWTKRELDEAVIAYKRALIEEGRTPGTVTTYTGDARRFVDWLACDRATRDRGAARRSTPARAATPRRGVRQGGAISAPVALRRLVSDWKDGGRQPQSAISWPRDRWQEALPLMTVFLGTLPDSIDRVVIRTICEAAGASERAAKEAFIATLVWGFGWVGYGPYRAVAILSGPKSASRLREVAEIASEKGALEAYRSLGGENRIKGLGPAFGTKFISFCQSARSGPTALIHDELVTSWLEANGRGDLRASTWAPRKYEAYLHQMQAWALELSVDPETIEYLVFQDEADKRPGNQWARQA